MANSAPPPAAETRAADAPPLRPRDPIGALLRRAREEQGGDLERIAAQLRIRSAYLAAIEQGRYDRLPGAVYALGFVRAYANHLGLDGDEAVRRFKLEAAGLDQRQDLTFPAPLAQRSIPGGRMVLVALILAICAYGIWHYVSSDRSRPERVAAVPSDLLPPPPPLAEAPAPQAAAPVAPAGPAAVGTAAAPPAGSAAQPAPAMQTAALPPAAAAGAPAASPPTTPPATGSLTAPPPAAAAPAAPGTPAPPQPSAPILPSVPGTAAAQNGGPAAPAAAPTAQQVQQPAPAQSAAAAAAAPAANPAATTQTAAAQPAPDASAPPAAPPGPHVYGAVDGPSRITLKAIQDSWIQVREGDSQDVVAQRTLRTGDTYRVPDRGDLLLRTGNASGLEVTVDDKVAPALGGTVRNVALDPARLMAGTAVE